MIGLNSLRNDRDKQPQNRGLSELAQMFSPHSLQLSKKPVCRENANLEMIIRHYARWSRRPERVGTLAHQLSARFPSKKAELA
jgi:hypothetical protein